MDNDYNVISFTAHQYELEQPLRLGQQVTFQGRGSIDVVKSSDGQGQGNKIVHKLRPELLEVVKDDYQSKETVSKGFGGTRKSPSKKLRDSLYILWEYQTKSEDFEEFYSRMMDKIINKVQQQIDSQI